MSLRRVLRASCGALATVACGAGARADDGPLRFLFDGARVVDPGLSFTFSRDCDSVDSSGAPVPAGRARYGDPTLLCGAPRVTTMPGTAGYGNVNLMGAGVSSDNSTPMLVVLNSTLGRARVVLGDLPPFEYDTTPNAAKGGQIDFLRNSIDASPDEAWSMKAAVVCHGVAVALCAVAVRDAGGAFVPDRVGFASCRAADLSLPRQYWWRRVGYSDTLTVCASSLRIGNTWAMQTWFAPGQEGVAPTRAWLAATDYRADPCKTGGVFAVLPLTRAAAQSDAWEVGAPCELPGRFVQTNYGTHAHAAGLARYGTSGLVVVGSRGDSLFNNTNYAWTIDDENAYLAGATVPAGALNYYTGPSSWTGPAVIHGCIIEPTAPVAQRALGNQWVSLAAGPVPGTFIAGADEVNQALWATSSLASDPSHVEFTPLYAPTPSNWIPPPGYFAPPANRYLSFHTALAEPRGPHPRYVAQLGPGNASAEHSLNARILYSPDGVHWGQFWAHRENEQTNVALTGGRVYTGSLGLGTALGVRSSPEPAWRLQRPLRLARGSTNYVRADALTPVTLAPSVSVTPGRTNSPCAGPEMHVAVSTPAGATPQSLGTFTLADSPASDAGVVRLRLWVRGDTLAEGGKAGSLALQFGLRRWSQADGSSSAVPSGLCPPIYLPGTGAWTPIVLSCDLSQWWQGEDPCRLDLVISPAGGQWLNGSFRVAVDTLSVGNTVPVPVAPGQAGADEAAVLSLQSAAPEWSALLAGMVPADSWDPIFVSSWFPSIPVAEITDTTGSCRLQFGFNPTSLTFEAWMVRDGVYLPQHVAVPKVFCSTGSPFVFAASYDPSDHSITIRASAAGNEIASGTIDAQGAFDLSRITLSPTVNGYEMGALDWFGGRIDRTCRSAESLDASLLSLDFLMNTPCPSDYNHDGFVSGDDFDGFISAFVIGSADADFNGDGFSSGDDFDEFVIAFEFGC